MRLRGAGAVCFGVYSVVLVEHGPGHARYMRLDVLEPGHGRGESVDKLGWFVRCEAELRFSGLTCGT